ERALAVADVEQYATLTRVDHRAFHRALRRRRRIRERPERVGQHVPRPQPRDHLFIAWRRIIDMRHHRHADLVSDLEDDVERPGARTAGGARADADLDADDDVAVGI